MARTLNSKAALALARRSRARSPTNPVRYLGACCCCSVIGSSSDAVGHPASGRRKDWIGSNYHNCLSTGEREMGNENYEIHPQPSNCTKSILNGINLILYY